MLSRCTKTWSQEGQLTTTCCSTSLATTLRPPTCTSTGRSRILRARAWKMNWLTDWFIGWMTDVQYVDWLTTWLIYWLIDWLDLIDCLNSSIWWGKVALNIWWYARLTNWLPGWLVGLLINRLSVSLIDWLIDWLINWLYYRLPYWLLEQRHLVGKGSAEHDLLTIC